MEIIAGLLIIGAVIALARLWYSASQGQSDTRIQRDSYSSSTSIHPSNSWLLYETLQSSSSTDTSAASTDSDPSSWGSDSTQPDSSLNSGGDWSASSASDPGGSGYDSAGSSSGSDGGGSGGGGDAF
ncbi:MAG TPA: hypothetical protein VFE61_00180 [Candidatus Sulfotelmatobacter sp.]|nr:hypothetical protein [Candidatus Sulfotelmatobacter sp.]